MNDIDVIFIVKIIVAIVCVVGVIKLIIFEIIKGAICPDIADRIKNIYEEIRKIQRGALIWDNVQQKYKIRYSFDRYEDLSEGECFAVRTDDKWEPIAIECVKDDSLHGLRIINCKNNKIKYVMKICKRENERKEENEAQNPYGIHDYIEKEVGVLIWDNEKKEYKARFSLSRYSEGLTAGTWLYMMTENKKGCKKWEYVKIEYDYSGTEHGFYLAPIERNDFEGIMARIIGTETPLDIVFKGYADRFE